MFELLGKEHKGLNLHFKAKFKGKPSKEDVAKAQETIGYPSDEYGGPWDIQVCEWVDPEEVIPTPGLFLVTWHCGIN